MFEQAFKNVDDVLWRTLAAPKQEYLLKLLRDHGSIALAQLWATLEVSRQGAMDLLHPLLQAGALSKAAKSSAITGSRLAVSMGTVGAARRISPTWASSACLKPGTRKSSVSVTAQTTDSHAPKSP